MPTKVDIPSIKLLESEFKELDVEMKTIVSDWQGSYINGNWAPNIHDDPEKDFPILERLFALYDKLTTLSRKYTEIYDDYPELKKMMDDNLNRLKIATEQIQKGDSTFVDSPSKESFHTSWMNLHQNLIAFVKKML